MKIQRKTKHIKEGDLQEEEVLMKLTYNQVSHCLDKQYIWSWAKIWTTASQEFNPVPDIREINQNGSDKS